MPSCHSSPLHTSGCSVLLCRKDRSSYQNSKNHLMVCQRASSLQNSLEISGDICHASMQQTDRHVHWSTLVKSNKKANSTVTWTKNFCWAMGPFRSQQWDLPAWSGQVQTYANDYSQFFSLDPNFSNSFTFCSDDHTCPRTRALTAEKWLCWKIKPKAPTGATEDQIIGIGENLWNCCIKSQVKKQEKKKTIEKNIFCLRLFFPSK